MKSAKHKKPVAKQWRPEFPVWLEKKYRPAWREGILMFREADILRPEHYHLLILHTIAWTEYLASVSAMNARECLFIRMSDGRTRRAPEYKQWKEMSAVMMTISFHVILLCRGEIPRETEGEKRRRLSKHRKKVDQLLLRTRKVDEEALAELNVKQFGPVEI